LEPVSEVERPWSKEGDDVRKVLDFWFNFVRDDKELSISDAAFWFIRNSVVDDLIRSEFGGLLDKALLGELDDWTATPCGSIALIVLCDQFTRNMYRDTPGAWKADKKALEISKHLVEGKKYCDLPGYMVFFLTFPFQRVESLPAVKQSTKLFAELLEKDDQIILQKRS